MHLVIMGVALEVRDGLLPVGRQDVLVRAREALMHVGPCARVQLRGSESLGGQGSTSAVMSSMAGVVDGLLPALLLGMWRR